MAKKPRPEGRIVATIMSEDGYPTYVNDACFRGMTHEDGEKVFQGLVDVVQQDINRRIANGETEELLAKGILRRRTPEEMKQARQK